MPEAAWQLKRKKYGSLDAAVILPPEGWTIDRLVVMCHGFGAGGDDLVGLAPEWIQAAGFRDSGPAFVFPAGPISLDEDGMPEGRAWWRLNLAALMNALQTQNFAEVCDHEPPGLEEARTALTEAIRVAQADFDMPTDRLYLGGFSQGAMLAADTAVRGLGSLPRELILFSGCLICRPQWLAAGERLKGVPVLQSHGAQDTVLPLQCGYWLKDTLETLGCDVQFIEFMGAHTIPKKAMDAASLRFSLPVD